MERCQYQEEPWHVNPSRTNDLRERRQAISPFRTTNSKTTKDACLIAAGQRAEHYEIAAYGTLIAWARAMGHGEVTSLLQQNLDEEKAADEKLTRLAEGGINQSAADVAHPEGEEPAAVGVSGARKTSAKTKASRR